MLRFFKFVINTVGVNQCLTAVLVVFFYDEAFFLTTVMFIYFIKLAATYRYVVSPLFIKSYTYLLIIPNLTLLCACKTHLI